MPKELVRARACGGWTRAHAHTSMISAFAWLGQWQIARWARVPVPVAHSLWPALGACARVVYRCWGGSVTDRRRARERGHVDDLPVCITEHTGQAGRAEGRPHRTRAQEAHDRPLRSDSGAAPRLQLNQLDEAQLRSLDTHVTAQSAPMCCPKPNLENYYF